MVNGINPLAAFGLALVDESAAKALTDQMAANEAQRRAQEEQRAIAQLLNSLGAPTNTVEAAQGVPTDIMRYAIGNLTRPTAVSREGVPTQAFTVGGFGLPDAELMAEQEKIRMQEAALAAGAENRAIEERYKRAQIAKLMAEAQKLESGAAPSAASDMATPSALPKLSEKASVEAEKLAIRDARKALSSYRESANAADNTLLLVKQMRNALKGVETGPLIGQVPTYLAPGTTSKLQTIDSISPKFTVDATIPLKGAISEREISLLTQTSPGRTLEPEANENVLMAHEAGAARAKEKAAFMSEFIKRDPTMADAEAAWQLYIEENPIINDDLTINQNNIRNWRGYIDAYSTGGLRPGKKSGVPPELESMGITAEDIEQFKREMGQ
jgi:hypothetical protein